MANGTNENKNKGTGILSWVFLMIVFIMLQNFLCNKPQEGKEIIFSDFISALENNKIEEVLIVENNITGKFKDIQTVDDKITKGEIFRTYGKDPELIKLLREKKIKVKQEPPKETHWLISLLYYSFPVILLMIFWGARMKKNDGGISNILSFGKNRAKLSAGKTKTFADVAGVDEAKDELIEIVEFLKNPKKFTALGGHMPKGVLLVGPPGTGKTLLAQAVAGEAGVPFFSISGSDFVEMFVGVGASRVRDLFAQGQKSAPCIIFIDEIDATGGRRGIVIGGGQDERGQTLNQLLVEMDGFSANNGIIVMAATNRPDTLDPALLRSGRFDRRVVVPRPDIKGREEILKIHTRKVPLAEDVNLAVLARGIPGFVGADIENLVNEATLLASKNNKKTVSMGDFENAKDKVMMGSERKTAIISDEERKLTAYHEAGHALVAKMLPDADPIHKVTIIPRGLALGITQQLPLTDKYTYSKEDLLIRLAVLMGGRAAEKLVFNKISTGASNDIEKATEIARDMVCKWGMSEFLGPVTLVKNQGIFLNEGDQPNNYSERTAVQIDEEIRKMIKERAGSAENILKQNLASLHKIAKKLLEKESLDGNEIDFLLSE